MIRFTLLIIIILSLPACTCSRRRTNLNGENLIPEKELVSILTDVYIADGLLSLPDVRKNFSTLDSISVYNDVIKKHGYSKEAMDNTMKYYFIKNPKRLIAMYDQVLGKFSEQESLLDKESIIAQRNMFNVWNGKDFYSLPESGGPDSTMFNIRLYTYGLYTLTFSATLYPDDQSVNPCLSLFTCNPDSIDTGKKKYIKILNYIKDGQPHKYIIIFKVHEKAFLNVRGWFYFIDNNIPEMEKHAIFDNISFTSSNALL